ncbi:uncharacterized protein N7511_001450 [Penicillium nucicola]|uniref:uncharacterized protein n=1 Tax=Penicillium nucicola TaxID=1850975 RepID=UPI0025454B94|nr:uncharacterized protein N7511_001450 [Penicillium nucicola]KAJ5776439.1 hypothetical protein N7511_001450 [Penicillium nucicola]
MFQSRLRPLPRANPTTTVQRPDFGDNNEEIDDESQEDIFSSYLAHLLPDDAPSFHGDPGQHLLYSSPRYGELDIMVPSYPGESQNRSDEIAAGQTSKVDEGRKLFAHFLWSAAMVVADEIELADEADSKNTWAVEGETVLELGAGAGLPSIISALSKASAVTITDHPSSPALSGAIKFNISYNLSKRTPPLDQNVSIQPHEWGVLDDEFSIQKKGSFTRIIAADCFWMQDQHQNLARTMQWFLAPGGRVFVVAGFHTGRPIVAGFIETVLENGFVIESIYERDAVERAEDGSEIRREWMPVREGEVDRSRWCVVAILKRE